jgi:hypothetical protein
MNIYTHAVPSALREANSKVVNLVLPAQAAYGLNAPLSSLANLQLTVRKGSIGRGGGDRKDKLANKACALNVLQPRPLSNWNKRNRRQVSPPWAGFPRR